MVGEATLLPVGALDSDGEAEGLCNADGEWLAKAVPLSLAVEHAVAVALAEGRAGVSLPLTEGDALPAALAVEVPVLQSVAGEVGEGVKKRAVGEAAAVAGAVESAVALMLPPPLNEAVALTRALDDAVAGAPVGEGCSVRLCAEVVQEEALAVVQARVVAVAVPHAETEELTDASSVRRGEAVAEGLPEAAGGVAVAAAEGLAA